MQSQTMAEKLQRPRPMNLFSQWEVEGTSSSCVPRVCTLRIVRLEVSRSLELDLTELVISVSMRGSRRNLRSDCIPLQPAGPIDVELDFAFSLQYPHFLKRHGNLLRVMLQRKKKYKGRTMLGYKTLAVGQIDMAQVLQGYAQNNLHLYMKEEKAPVATITLASLSSQSVDQEVSGRRESGHDNLSSTDEEGDDDLSGSEAEFSAGEIEARVFDPSDPRSMIRNKAARTFKNKFIDAIFKRLKANQEVYDDDIADDLYVDPPVAIEDDNQIDFPDDEDEESDAEELFGDSCSIGSNQRPKLRPYFDQISRNESLQALARDHLEEDQKASPRSGKEMESGDDSKELSPSSDSDPQKDTQPKMANDLQVGQSSLQMPLEKTSPFKGATNRSLSFKERAEPNESSDRHQIKRKSSVDFDSLPQLSVLPLGDQMLAALNADDIIPEKVFLISIKDSVGQILAMKLMNRIERLICTTNDNDVNSVIATITSKLQKYCNKHSAAPPSMRVCIIGPENYLSAVLRSYVDHFSLKSAEFQSYLRFLIVPIGYHRLAKYLGGVDSCYSSLFVDQFWRNFGEQPSKRDEDYDEIEKRILYYTKSASTLLLLPIAEALITYKAGKSAEGESSQACVPFVMEVRVSGPGSDTESEEPNTTQSLPRDIPSVTPAPNSTSVLSSSPNSRESSLDKNVVPISGQWGSPMQSETLDLQMDYWPAGSSFQTSKKDDKKEQNKLSIKTGFKSLAVTRLPSSGNDDSSILYLSAQTKARSKVVMRLKRPKDKDTESKSIINASVNKVVCTSKSHSQTFNVNVDGAEWCGIKFFALSSQWPTHVKNFPIGIFGSL